jgi:hypothetical protein
MGVRYVCGRRVSANGSTLQPKARQRWCAERFGPVAFGGRRRMMPAASCTPGRLIDRSTRGLPIRHDELNGAVQPPELCRSRRYFMTAFVLVFFSGLRMAQNSDLIFESFGHAQTTCGVVRPLPGGASACRGLVSGWCSRCRLVWCFRCRLGWRYLGGSRGVTRTRCGGVASFLFRCFV